MFSDNLDSRLRQDDIGKLILRLTVAGLTLMHGIFKLQNGVSNVAEMLANDNLPTAMAYLVYIGEVFGPLLVIAGFYARVGALLMTISMLFAFALAHPDQILKLTPMGGWAMELQGLLLFGSMAIVALGAGRFSIGGTKGRLN
jgi:putative oxidoreductase